MSNILTHILIIILKTLIPATCIFLIPTVLSNVLYPAAYSHRGDFLVNTVIFSLIGTVVFLFVIDLLKIIGVSNGVVDYFTEKHHYTLLAYIKYGYSTHPIFTTIFFLYLLFCIINTITFTAKDYHEFKNKLNSKMNTSKREI